SGSRRKWQRSRPCGSRYSAASRNDRPPPFSQPKQKRHFRGVFRILRTPPYFAFIKATVVSSIRLEKPHSLSYQDETFTRRPDTLVSVASKLLDAGLWL